MKASRKWVWRELDDRWTFRTWLCLSLLIGPPLAAGAGYLAQRSRANLCPDDRSTAIDTRCYVPEETAIVYDGRPDAGPTEFVGPNGGHSWLLTEWRAIHVATERVFHCAGGVDLIGPVRASEEDICAQAPGAKP